MLHKHSAVLQLLVVSNNAAFTINHNFVKGLTLNRNVTHSAYNVLFPSCTLRDSRVREVKPRMALHSV